MSARKYLEQLKREIEKYPGVEASFDTRSKHKQLTLSYEGRSRFVVLPTTPGDGLRIVKNTLRDVRAELRNLGVAA